MQQLSPSRRTLAVLLGLAAVAPARAAAGIVQMGVNASRLTPLNENQYIPPSSLAGVANIYRRMTTPVTIGGKGPYPFIVDTGANQSVISDELAQDLALPPGAAAPLNGIAGISLAPTVVTTLGVGRGARRDVTLSILPAAAIGAAGMLGLDGLEGQQVTLDFAGQTLKIGAGERFAANPYEVVVHAQRKNGQLILVDADLAGFSMVAFIDSGSQNTIGNLALRAKAIKRKENQYWSPVPLLSATGQSVVAQLADLPKLRIATLNLSNWPVAFADLHTFQMWGLTERPAILLGIDVLSRFESVCIDFRKDEVRFRLPRAVDTT
ncbi:MAG: retroviral-like aspartic protease family protein [Caulobacteraceae bacterium]|nr:retroviral-like aspartic protease family protein [Caulobacteraceae bacterium]